MMFCLRKSVLSSSSILFVVFLIKGSAFASEPAHHQLTIELDRASSRIRVQDRIYIKEITSNCENLSFYLNAGLKLDHKGNLAGLDLR